MTDNFESYSSLPKPKYSDKHKRRMNKIFREAANCSKIPYPEVDNSFERSKSKLTILQSKATSRLIDKFKLG